MRTLYSLLNCDSKISDKELKQLYFKLLREIHPDKGGKADFDQFLVIKKAWEVLGNSTSRVAYDFWLREQQIRENKELISDEIYVSENDLLEQNFVEHCHCGGVYEQLSVQIIKNTLDCFLLECSSCSLCLKVWKIDDKNNDGYS